MKHEIVRVDNVTRTVEGVVLLDNISFYIREEEIVGLLPINDRGEGELVRVLTRNLPIESGRVFFGGKLVNSYLNSDYSENKVCVIGQHSSLIEGLSICDNLFVMRAGFKKYMIKETVLKDQAQRLFRDFSMEVDLNKRVDRLTTLERILVETAKACLMGCRLLVYLYPDKMISQVEYEPFHRLLLKMKSFGLSALYVCYHHKTLFPICDRVALFSNNRIVKKLDSEQFGEKALRPYIQTFEGYQSTVRIEEEKPVFELKNIKNDAIECLNLTARQGECVTLFDSDKQITDALMDVLTGKDGDFDGLVSLSGQEINLRLGKSLDDGMIVLDDNHTDTFLFPEMTYLENVYFLLDRKLKKSRLKRSYRNSIRNEFYREAGEAIDETNIALLPLKERYGIVYNKISLFHPKVLFIKKPFAHGDMACRKYILERIQELKEAGVSIILITNYITDCCYISDRIVVCRDGKNVVSLDSHEYHMISGMF